MRVLLVTKDLGSKPVVDLGQAVRKHGHEAIVVCEGLSARLWFDAGFRPYIVGPEDPRLESFTVNALQTLDKFKPSVVITGRGDPIHLEQAFGLAANARNIPLVLLEDFWNGYRSSTAEPDMILTIDEYAASLARKGRPKAVVQIVGSAQVPQEIPFVSPPLPEIEALKKKYGPAVLFIGGETTEDLDLVIRCMEETRGFLMVRFHPKHKVLPMSDGRTREDVWKGMLAAAPLGNRVIYDTTAKPELYIDNADVVCSGASLGLVSAICRGKPSVVLDTPGVSRVLERVVGLPIFPAASLGAAYAIQAPCDLAEFIKKGPLENRSKLVPYDAELAYCAIARYL